MDLPRNPSETDPLDRDLIEETLRFVAERSWRLGDAGFFQDLVSFLGRALGVSYAFCDAIDQDDPTKVNTIALFAHGEVTENISYSLKDTPCENVLGRSFCCYVEGVQRLFPNDGLLVEMNAESYAGIPLWASDGSPIGLVAVINEDLLERPANVETVLQIIAARAGAELERLFVLEQLKFSERRFADFADISSDWFWETDTELRFSYFSDRFEAVTGVPPHELLGRTRREVGAPGASPRSFDRLVADMDAHQAFRDFEHDRIKQTGEVVHLTISGTPVFDATGQFLGYRGIGRDVTRQRQIQNELLESRNAAETANRVKSEFLASMSHELRTPLNAVLGFAQLLSMDRKNPLTTAQLDQLDAIIHGGNHLLALVNDILDLARIEANQIGLAVEEVSIAASTRTCLSLLNSTAENNEVSLQNSIEDDCPLRIWADSRRFDQVLINLISNGIRYNQPGGTVNISAQLVDDGAFVRVVVADTGIGIAAQDHKDVFQMFTRVGQGPTISSEGAGIGLTVTKLLVERMGGHIGFDSEKDKGSEFWIEMPAVTDA